MAPLQLIKKDPNRAFYSLVKGNTLQLKYAKASRAYALPTNATQIDQDYKRQNTLLDLWIKGLIK
jgi:hypothetical protein